MSKKNIYLSAGHSGKGEKGAAANGYDERTEAMRIVDYIKESRHMYSFYKFPEPEMKLKDRVQDANRFCGVASGVAVEIHFNAGGGNGCEAVISNMGGYISKSVALDLSRLVSRVLKIKNRGVKTEGRTGHDKLAFVSDTICPAVILEICFIDSEEDMRQYNTKFERLCNELAIYFASL